MLVRQRITNSLLIPTRANTLIGTLSGEDARQRGQTQSAASRRCSIDWHILFMQQHWSLYRVFREIGVQHVHMYGLRSNDDLLVVERVVGSPWRPGPGHVWS